jgi:hypothetical protein
MPAADPLSDLRIRDELRVGGRVLRIARPREEWDTDVDDPAAWIAALRGPGAPRADLFTFMQRLPESRPRFKFRMEWDNVAALPIRDYDSWFKHQLHQNPRNKLRKAAKAGLEVREAAFDDDFIRGIREIQDELPIRQGRRFAYYRKDLEWIRLRYGTYHERARFIGAYFRGEMIGFLKLVTAGRFVRTMGLLAKVGCRDLAPMNALIGKAVAVCAEIGMPWLVYGRYDYGKIGADSVVSYKFYNGFEHILLPRYFVPLTAAGRAALALGLHHGWLGFAPRPLVQRLRALKVAYYERKFRGATAAAIRRGNELMRAPA